MSKKMTFDEWYLELIKIFDKNELEDMRGSGQECWRDYYNDDVSPEDAFSDELSYWAD